jgi:hypothetical protein
MGWRSAVFTPALRQSGEKKKCSFPGISLLLLSRETVGAAGLSFFHSVHKHHTIFSPKNDREWRERKAEHHKKT